MRKINHVTENVLHDMSSFFHERNGIEEWKHWEF